MSRPAPPAAALSPRQELFAVALASGSTAAEAYRAAGFRPHRSNAARLSANDNVRRRVAELQARALRRADVTIDNLLEELESARRQALAEGRCAAAVAATMGKAKLVGLGGEQVNTSVTVTSEMIERLSDRDFAALEAALPALQILGIVPAQGFERLGDSAN